MEGLCRFKIPQCEDKMYTVADLKKGLKITLDGDPYLVVAFDFVKPGKGQALYRTKMRNMMNGTLLDRTYRSGETFESANLEERLSLIHISEPTRPY